MAKTKKATPKKASPKKVEAPKKVATPKKVVEKITYQCRECGQTFEKKGKCPRCYSSIIKESVGRS